MKCNPDLDCSQIHEHHQSFKTPTEYFSAQQSEALWTRSSPLHRREK